MPGPDKLVCLWLASEPASQASERAMEALNECYTKAWALRSMVGGPSQGELLWERSRYPWHFGGDRNWDNITSRIQSDVYCSHATHGSLSRMMYDGNGLNTPSAEDKADWDAYLASLYINLKSNSWCSDKSQRAYSLVQFCHTWRVAGVLQAFRCDYPDPSLGGLSYQFAGPCRSLKLPRDALINIEDDNRCGPSDFTSRSTGRHFSAATDVPARCYHRNAGLDLHLLVCRAYDKGPSLPRFIFRFLVSATLTRQGLMARVTDQLLLAYKSVQETEGEEGEKTLTDYQTAAICCLGHRNALPECEPFFCADPRDDSVYVLNEFHLAPDRSWLLN